MPRHRKAHTWKIAANIKQHADKMLPEAKDDRYLAAPYGLWISPDGVTHRVTETNGHYNKLKGLGMSDNQIAKALALGWIRGVFIKDDKTLEYEHGSRMPTGCQLRQVRKAAEDSGMEWMHNTTLNKRIGVYESEKLDRIYLRNAADSSNPIRMPSWQERYGKQ